MNDVEEFWASYYRELSQHGEHWLDYSNERVQAQTFAIVLAALGPVAGRRALDVGCGFGQLARALDAMGARQVTGIDVTAELIEPLKRSHPGIRWQVGTLSELGEQLGPFELISLVEVLQYVPVAAALQQAWSLLVPGGRLVAVVPNRECPIVARAIARFPGKFLPPSAAELVDVGGSLDQCQGWGLQGMVFGEDQSIVPYAVSAWTRCAEFDFPGHLPKPPNRLVFAAAKSSAPEPSRG